MVLGKPKFRRNHGDSSLTAGLSVMLLSADIPAGLILQFVELTLLPSGHFTVSLHALFNPTDGSLLGPEALRFWPGDFTTYYTFGDSGALDGLALVGVIPMVLCLCIHGNEYCCDDTCGYD